MSTDDIPLVAARPGDLIVFCYFVEDATSEPFEPSRRKFLRSSNGSWASIDNGFVNLLLTDTGDSVSWLNEKGMFTVSYSDLKVGVLFVRCL
jgi:hypothetical protein